jgi:hypothetical protein
VYSKIDVLLAYHLLFAELEQANYFFILVETVAAIFQIASRPFVRCKICKGSSEQSYLLTFID